MQRWVNMLTTLVANAQYAIELPRVHIANGDYMAEAQFATGRPGSQRR